MNINPVLLQDPIVNILHTFNMPRNYVIGIDLDGTIVDCYPRQVKVTKYILEVLSLEATVDTNTLWHYKRRGYTTADAMLAQGVNPSAVKLFKDMWLEIIERDEWLVLDQPFPWAKDALEKLVMLNFTLVLVTARQRESGVYQLLAQNSLVHFFKEVHIVTAINAIAEKTSILLRIKPFTYCGDSEVDAIAADQAQISFVGVISGQRSKDCLQQYPHKVILNNISELPEFIVNNLSVGY
ncbi:MAG: HAD family hydrolase [Pseudanabaenaceae cyanobacterium]